MLFVRWCSALTVVAAVGEFDMANRDALHGQLLEAANGGAGRVVLDMSQMTFADCSVLGALLEVRNRIMADGGTLTLAGAQRTVMRVFEVTGLHETFAMRHDVQAVVARDS